MFIQPLAFNKTPDQTRPLYARLHGLKRTPLVAAGVFAFSMQSFCQWFFWLKASQAPTFQTPADWIRQLHEIQIYIFWGGFAFALASIYIISLFRWSYHCSVLFVFRRWQPNLPKPPFLYFLITWSAWGMWLSLFLIALTLGLWKVDDWQKMPDNLSEYVSTHFGVVMMFILPLGLACLTASGNSDTGRKAMYGGFALASLLIDLLLSIIVFFNYCPSIPYVGFG